jgi:hypothetical protein
MAAGRQVHRTRRQPVAHRLGDTAPPLLAEEGFEATWVVEPLD